jgi:hypothetical protein
MTTRKIIKDKTISQRVRNHFFKSSEILELKNTMNDVKNAIESCTGRLDQAEQRICDIEYK